MVCFKLNMSNYGWFWNMDFDCLSDMFYYENSYINFYSYRIKK